MAALAPLAGVRASGIAAGLHAVVELTDADAAEADVVARLATAGVAVHPLGRYWNGPPRGVKGLVVGFGTPPAHAFPTALAALIAALS